MFCNYEKGMPIPGLQDDPCGMGKKIVRACPIKKKLKVSIK